MLRWHGMTISQLAKKERPAPAVAPGSVLWPLVRREADPAGWPRGGGMTVGECRKHVSRKGTL